MSHPKRKPDPKAAAVSKDHRPKIGDKAEARRDGRLSDDLLHGAEAIADFLFGDPEQRRKVYHLSQMGNLPVFRLGAILCARRSRLLAWIEQQEVQATNSPD